MIVLLFSTLAGKPIVEIVLVPKERLLGPDHPRHPDIMFVPDKMTTERWAHLADTDHPALEAFKKGKDYGLCLDLFGPIEISPDAPSLKAAAS